MRNGWPFSAAPCSWWKRPTCCAFPAVSSQSREKSENPRIELHPETIQKMIADDPATWTELVDGLHEAAVPALNAANAKNAKGLFDAGEHIERACESCHRQYWYPPESARPGSVRRPSPPRVLRQHQPP